MEKESDTSPVVTVKEFKLPVINENGDDKQSLISLIKIPEDTSIYKGHEKRLPGDRRQSKEVRLDLDFFNSLNI